MIFGSQAEKSGDMGVSKGVLHPLPQCHLHLSYSSIRALLENQCHEVQNTTQFAIY